MDKPEIFKYTYSYDFFGYEIKYDGIMIDGLCSIPEFMDNSSSKLWVEYHRSEAQKKLVEILKYKELWKQ